MINLAREPGDSFVPDLDLRAFAHRTPDITNPDFRNKPRHSAAVDGPEKPPAGPQLTEATAKFRLARTRDGNENCPAGGRKNK
ncbi:hypothetical protein EVAR_76368_1 [Eumeta japonica]|uniref:Uncharacterized protein n=1 Tax=Eumeta variegata TaxID=151549 RepID=A0A4C1TAL1_EUMVA|nr:hypothetical protein EVAR_76368_1 [Eumeta japonica]